MKEKTLIQNAVPFGSWEEVDNIPLSAITKNDNDTDKLNGLVIRGYEMKWDATNENGERYDKGAFDRFIQNYFVDNKLNMPVDVQHSQRWDALAGRVLLIEINSVGFYFVVYIPKTYVHYEHIKNLIKEGILQGFSKYGWATDYDFIYKADGTYDYTLIKEIEVLSVSLVATPANRLPFEKVGEVVTNALRFENKIIPDKSGLFETLFNN